MGTLRLVFAVSLPRLREHPLRTALTIAGVLLGVAAVVAVALVSRSLTHSIASTIDDIAGKTDWQVSAGPAGLDEGLLDAVRAVPGVYKITPVIKETVPIATAGMAPARAAALHNQQLVVLGIHFLGDDEHFRTYRSSELDEIKRDPLVFLNSPTNLLLSEGFAQKHGYKLRDTIPLLTPAGRKDFTIWGFLRDERLGRAMGGTLAVMYYQAAQVAFERGTLVDQLDVAVQKGEDHEAVRGRILKALGPGYEVERPERRTERVGRLLKGFNLLLGMGSALSLAVGLFLIFNTVFISIAQRKKEIGVLRALGMTRRQLLLLFVAEGALLGTVGSALGVVTGLQMARGLLRVVSRAVSEIYLQVHPEQVVVDRPLLLLCLIGGVVGTVLSSLWPAQQATHAQPVHALRSAATTLTGEESSAGHRRALDLAAALLLLCSAPLCFLPPVRGVPLFGYAAVLCVMTATVLLVPRALLLVRALLRPAVERLFGVEGQLANENLVRDLGRSSISTAALTIAVAMVTSFAVMLKSFEDSILRWVDQTVPADLFITSANPFASAAKNVHITDEMYPFLTGLPGVQAVDRVRIIDLSFRDAQVKLLSLDWKVNLRHARLTYLSGTPKAADAALSAGTGVLISESLAQRFSYHTGDHLQLSAPGGMHDFLIAAVVVDYTSDQGLIVVDRALCSRVWRDSKVDTYKLYLAPGTSSDAVRGAVNAAYGERFTLYILSNAQFKDELRALLRQAFGLVDALQLVALLIAVLGVINTMLASVLDRAREIGVLRAVGGQRRQVHRMIICEAGLMGLAGCAAGVAAGMLVGGILLYVINTVNTGWLWPYSVPILALLKMTATVVVAAALAGWYPARTATHAPITTTLKYE